MVYRIYVERRAECAQEAQAQLADIRDVLGVRALADLRILNRYDAEGVDGALFSACRHTVFAEPQTDIALDSLPEGSDAAFAIEYLPGQFDQRAEAAAQCMALISQKEAPAVRTARVYLLYGALSQADAAAIKQYLINPVECHEASLEPCASLALPFDAPLPVPVLQGFTSLDAAGLTAMIAEYGLAMDADDLKCCRDHFRSEGRDPTLTEIRLLDTYWSDHCRHTTFLTELDNVTFDDPRAQATFERYLTLRGELGAKKPVTLMDMATVAARYFKAKGLLPKLDDSAEINACTVKVDIDVNGEKQPWFLLFKNETHNHPTEIEPFGGAATCIGGAIRDPLSGRAYVYQAMRLTGAADPRRPYAETLPGKLPQRKLVATAAAGYSSYGNQIGLATGLVDEIYHEGFLAKRMEVGAVIGAAPAKNVRRETPADGDVVILLGGRTGRDGCGGATGSSKAHTEESLSRCGAEVQKGNAPEERKLQRLFRNPEAARRIKRCNDFGAGGVAVAVGELADGVSIDLDAVPRKYEGLDGTELAISESQERMAVVVAKEDVSAFITLANEENLGATVIAHITGEARLTMRWQGQKIVDIPRSFIDSNGARKHAKAHVEAPGALPRKAPQCNFEKSMKALLSDLSICSRQGLSERFDSTVGANTVLLPFGGARQLTPIQAMAAKFPILDGETDACSLMAWGYDPHLSEASPYAGAYTAVVSALAKLIASGVGLEECYLSFQEYFGKPGSDPSRWGKPAAALLGALQAQLDFSVAAIGGKDSMSGSFGPLDVPPTLVSFAVALSKTGEVISPEFKCEGSNVVLLAPDYQSDGLPDANSQKAVFAAVRALASSKKAHAAYAVGSGGIAEAVFKMCLGNGFGFEYEASYNNISKLFAPLYGAFVIELDNKADIGRPLGRTSAKRALVHRDERVDMDELEAVYHGVLEDIFPTRVKTPPREVETISYRASARVRPKTTCGGKPRILIPVFPGTNCEYESARALTKAGAVADVLVVNTLSPAALDTSIREFAARLDQAQALFIPGGFSNGDEPDGSGKFIAAFMRNPLIADALMKLLDARYGLALGICNGFQALVKLGLLPYGRITEPSPASPTLTYNAIGRHQSRIVRTRVCSVKSPWLMRAQVGDIYSMPISHGEGRFLCMADALKELIQNGLIAAQYVDEAGKPSMDIRFNPSGSYAAIEAVTSMDGRILGKMGHSERVGHDLYKNVSGNYDMGLFESAVEYFK